MNSDLSAIGSSYEFLESNILLVYPSGVIICLRVVIKYFPLAFLSYHSGSDPLMDPVFGMNNSMTDPARSSEFPAAPIRILIVSTNDFDESVL